MDELRCSNVFRIRQHPVLLKDDAHMAVQVCDASKGDGCYKSWVNNQSVH